MGSKKSFKKEKEINTGKTYSSLGKFVEWAIKVIDDKNCSLSNVLTAMDQKLQKS